MKFTVDSITVYIILGIFGFMLLIGVIYDVFR